MTQVRDAIGVGILFLVGGASIVLVGLHLIHKCRSEANYRGIGSFRWTPGGVTWLIGYMLVIFGMSLVIVSLILLFV